MIKKVLCVILLFSMLISLVACGRDDTETVQNGIEIKEDEELSDAFISFAEKKVYEILERILLSELSSITDAEREELRVMAKDIVAIISRQHISEDRYDRLLMLFASYGKELILSFLKDDAVVSGVADIYLAVTGIIGPENAGAIVYELTLYGYGLKISKLREEYEEDNNESILEQIDRISYDLETVENIGKDDFVGAMKLVFALSELILGEGGGSLDGFSNEELLSFLSYTDILGLLIDERGWTFILSFGDELFSDSAVISALLGDDNVGNVANVMPDAISLIYLFSSRLTADDIGEMRMGNGGEVTVRLLSELTDAEWELFVRATSAELDTEAIDLAAVSEWGEDYLTYKSGIEKISADSLRADLGTEKSYESVKRYFEGLCPALFYGFGK